MILAQRYFTLPAAIGFAVMLGSFQALASEEKLSGVQLFETHCATCHLGDARGEDRIAPPVFAVQNHYFGQHPTKAGFVSAIVEWLEEPNEENALMPGAISRFGLMPPVKLADDERVALGEFLYEAKFDVPGWYEEHYREEHGEAPPSGGMQMQSGQGKGMGLGKGQHQKMGQHGGKNGQGHDRGDGQPKGWWQRLWGD